MTRSIVTALLAAAATTVLAAPAMADEMWNSDQGGVIYLADHGDYAVFRQAHPGSGERLLYIRGLPGRLDDRSGVFQGYWIDTDNNGQTTCDAWLTGADSTNGYQWGSLQIQFDSPSFPSGFTAYIGSCFGELNDAFVATPSTGVPSNGYK